MAVAFIVNHPQNLTRIYLEKIGENQMLMKRMTRVMVWVLCVWLLTALMGESAILNHSPRPALAQLLGVDIVTGTALNDTGASAAALAPVADFSGTPNTGPAPLQVQFSDESTGSPTNWAWYFGDEAFNEPWTQVTKGAEWSARSSHSSVVLPDGSIVLMGGHDGSYRNDVWRSTDQGTTWTKMAFGIRWTARWGHTSVALPNGNIVLMGGHDGTSRNDVWRSTDQGVTWTQMTLAAEWSARSGHTSVALPNGNIILMGSSGLTSTQNDIWRSTDQGATWELMTAAAPWLARRGHASVALPDGSIVLMGGYDPSMGRLKDVWRSTDQGENWTQMTAAAPWTARSGHSSVALPDGSIVMMGGWDGSNYLNDVWRSTDQGENWTQMTAAAPWTARSDHSSVALPDGNIVLMGGFTKMGSSTYRVNDVWRSTDKGVTWTQITTIAEWTRRSNHTSVVLPDDSSIVLMGGAGWDNYLNDVWRSTDQGTTWTQMTADAGWRGRAGHTSVALPDGSIVLMGGVYSDAGLAKYLNDVWRSTDQGATWTQMTDAAPWTKRRSHSSVALPNGSIVLMGGYDGSNHRNDVWRSTDQGATWTEMTTAAEWSTRHDHSSVAMPDGSIVLMGGFLNKNDIWRSTDQGATWMQMTAAAEWTGRYGHTSVVLPDGSIILMGGLGDSYRNDVWRSTDQGAIWTQVTPAAEWTRRTSHTSVAMPDGSIVLLGGFGSSFQQNDIWRLETAGSTAQHPMHIYTEMGTYSVALQAYNADGFSSMRRLAYINVTDIEPEPPGFMSIYLPLLVNQAP
jgi:hypothetical protein